MNHYEIEACVLGAKEGNTEDMLRLLEQYKNYVFKIALQFKIKNYEVSDLVQIGYVALMNAVTKYKIGSYSFSCYVFKAIKNALRYTARQHLRYDNELSLDAPLDTQDDNSSKFIDFLNSMVNIEDDLLDSEEIIEVRDAISKLEADEMELIITVYYNKCPLKNYAYKKGLTYLQAIRKKKNILEKLSYYLGR
jgi:RNA polymerase sigma factor (sigma-70 family)